MRAVELVTDYLEEGLTRSDLEHFSAHLSLCEGCRVFVDQARRTIRLTTEHGADEVEIGPANFDEVVSQVRLRRRFTGRSGHRSM